MEQNCSSSALSHDDFIQLQHLTGDFDQCSQLPYSEITYAPGGNEVAKIRYSSLDSLDLPPRFKLNDANYEQPESLELDINTNEILGAGPPDKSRLEQQSLSHEPTGAGLGIPYEAQSAANHDSNRTIGKASPQMQPLKTKDPRLVSKLKRRQRRREATVSISTPLSTLAKELKADVFDVTAFAYRPIQNRIDEYKTLGRVKRPLNAFMLYRKAYQETAKKLCPHENHQVISTLCGDSWGKLESEQFRANFRSLAAVEKVQHEEAFPLYRYNPSQARKSRDGQKRTPAACDVISRPTGAMNTGRGGSISQDQQLDRVHEYGQYYTSAFDEYSIPTTVDFETGGDVSEHQSWHLSTRQISQSGDLSRESVSYDSIRHFSHIDNEAASMECEPETRYYQDDGVATIVNPCVDPALLPNESIDSSVTMAQCVPWTTPASNWQQPGENVNIAYALPGLDVSGSHNACLGGGSEDWGVDMFDEASQFDDWIFQTECG